MNKQPFDMKEVIASFIGNQVLEYWNEIITASERRKLEILLDILVKAERAIHLETERENGVKDKAAAFS